MPKTKLQSVIFTIVMAAAMVYCMVCYNISLSLGGLTNIVFLMALQELLIMVPIAFVLEFCFVEKLATKMAFRIVNPRESKQPVIVIAISTMIVCCMCPLMSFFATIIFEGIGPQFIASWIQKTVLNFPAALLFQLFFVGPIVRAIFRKVFKNN